jgi:hypothetical protein
MHSVSDETESTAGDDALWTVTDVARFLNTSRSWCYHQSQQGKLPSLKIAGLLRFDPEAIRALARGEGVKGGRVIALPVR